jgi:rhodanese-related sulfurtransferase
MLTAGDHPSPISVLDREQLRTKLAARAPFKLVMAASDFGFRAKHIPGSLHVSTHGGTFASLAKDDDIVVYCSNADCNASKATIKKLVELGYQHVSHYAGGLIDWEAAGLPLEGEWADGASHC